MKIFRSVRINSYKRNFQHLYDFMLLRGSIESDNHNGAIENILKRSENSFNGNFQRLYGFMLLSGSIVSY